MSDVTMTVLKILNVEMSTKLSALPTTTPELIFKTIIVLKVLVQVGVMASVLDLH